MVDQQDDMSAVAESSHDKPSDGLVELSSLIGKGTLYEGNVHFEGRARIEGQFRGDIRGDDVLVIGPGADIDGRILVESCIVLGGRVRADIQATQAIELHQPAEVHGDLQCPNIFIDRGVKFEGKCKMEPPEDVTPS